MKNIVILIALYAIPLITFASDYTNTIGMEFIKVNAGCFLMGGDNDDESPKHKVCITRPFYLSKTEVTQAQWKSIMGENPSKHKNKNKPVETVSWNGVKKFIKEINKIEKTNEYRLPTEAEWEYSARAGSDTIYSFGDKKKDLIEYAWYGYDYKDKGKNWGTHVVAQKQPNRWGLYDMHGNVWEWVQDLYDENFYKKSPVNDPKGGVLKKNASTYNGSSFDRAISELNGKNDNIYNDRVLRGGGWRHPASRLTSATRLSLPPTNGGNEMGFRLLKEY